MVSIFIVPSGLATLSIEVDQQVVEIDLTGSAARPGPAAPIRAEPVRPAAPK